jgi:hypothetical protein
MNSTASAMPKSFSWHPGAATVTLRPYVTMWVVRADGDVYVRSAYGPDNPPPP